MNGIHPGDGSHYHNGEGSPPSTFLIEPEQLKHIETAPDAFSIADSDLDALPLTQEDDRQITLRHRKAAEARRLEEEARERALQEARDRKCLKERDLRQRTSYAKLKQQQRKQFRERMWGLVVPWWVYFRDTQLKTRLPAWFTQETTIESGDGVGQWQGLADLRRTWYAYREMAAVVIAFIMMAFIVWWLILPSALGVWRGAPDMGDMSLNRVDGVGRLIRAPLPLCDLLYDRKEYGRQQDALSLQVSKHATVEIRRWWQRNAPPTRAIPSYQDNGEIHADDYDMEVPPFVTRLPNHHEHALWAELCKDRVVRPSPRQYATDTSGLLTGAPVTEPYIHPKTGKPILRHDPRGFYKATKTWIRRHCQRSGGIVTADSFAVMAKRYGALQLPVTDYLTPQESLDLDAEAPVSNTQEGEAVREVEDSEDDYEVLEDPVATPTKPVPNDATRGLFDAIVDLDDDYDTTDYSNDRSDELDTKEEPPELPVKTSSAAPESLESHLAIAPPAPDIYRNVSIYELHVLLWHLASQGQNTHVEMQTAYRLEQQLGHRVAVLASDFIAPIPSSTTPPSSSSSTTDPWGPIVLDELRRMGQSQRLELLGLRAASLWSGKSSCVCPHHVGVPIPGAAWYEPALVVNGKTERKGRARVLFYPKSDAVEAQQRQNGDDVSGTLVHIFTSLFSSPAATTTPQHGVVEQDGSPTNADDELQVSWLHADPVLSPKIDTKGEQNTVLRLPTRALHQPWTWVEGIDYRGDRRRYRVAPRSLACVMTCTHTCGSSRSK